MVCLNCGCENVYPVVYTDNLGNYAVCESCHSSFDVDEDV